MSLPKGGLLLKKYLTQRGDSFLQTKLFRFISLQYRLVKVLIYPNLQHDVQMFLEISHISQLRVNDLEMSLLCSLGTLMFASLAQWNAN